MEEANARGYKAVRQPKTNGTGRTQVWNWVLYTENSGLWSDGVLKMFGRRSTPYYSRAGDASLSHFGSDSFIGTPKLRATHKEALRNIVSGLSVRYRT
jgi:hypothetical protein